jgi:hypothetical protein
VAEDQKVQEEELQRNCVERTKFSVEVAKSEEIWTIGSMKDTWQRSMDFRGRVLQRKGKVE